MKIEVLFPEFCNLFGDAHNMAYLEKPLPEAEFIRTKFSDDVRFTEEKAPAGLREQLAAELKGKLHLQNLSMALGIAFRTAPITDIDELIMEMDRKMYKDKKHPRK